MQEDRIIIIISIIITSFLIMTLIALIAFAILRFQKRQIDHQKRISALKSDFEKTLLATQLEIQEQTFQNISREIHDNIGLSLTLAKLNLNTISYNHIENNKDRIAGSVEFISKAIDDLSYISKSLNTGFIEENGLLHALELEIKQIKKLEIFIVNFEIKGAPIYMTTQKELVIFRTIQEVLNNSIKHAQASSLSVLLDYQHAEVLIEISDNGKGFDEDNYKKKSKKGTGLLNILTRAALVDGKCEVKSETGKGTKVTMRIPY